MFKKISMVLFIALFASTAFGKAGALIDYEGGKASAQLAKSWKKVSDSEYEFELDTSKMVSGSPVTPTMVKDTLEGKFGKKYEMAVTAKGAAGVAVSWKNLDEEEFLKKISKTKIRSKSVDIAMDSSSDGGIRANDMNRDPVDGEVKAIVVKAGKKSVKVKVSASKSSKIKGGVIKVDLGGKKPKANEILFFKPVSEAKGVWKVKDLQMASDKK